MKQVECCGSCKNICFDMEDGFYCNHSLKNTEVFKLPCDKYIQDKGANKWFEDIIK